MRRRIEFAYYLFRVKHIHTIKNPAVSKYLNRKNPISQKLLTTSEVCRTPKFRVKRHLSNGA